jgi:putative ABC transport system permease protein
VIGPRYFETLGIELLAGRDFDERDAAGAPGVVVVNEAFRRLHFPELPRRELLSRRLSLSSANGPWLEIVGVVGDGKYWSLTESSMPVAYVPLAQRHETGMVLYVRASGDPARLVPAVRREVRALEPNLPLPELRTVREAVQSSLYVPRMGSALIGVFAALALFLAAIGVYGVTSFAIAQRTREIGVRMALGARSQNVLALVLDQGMRLVAYGVGLGLLLALAAGQSLEAFLFGVSGKDAATLLAVPLLLAAVALVACLVPARRAMKLDPLAALRYR